MPRAALACTLLLLAAACTAPPGTQPAGTPNEGAEQRGQDAERGEGAERSEEGDGQRGREEAPIETLGRDFFVRQKVTARFGDEERRFDAALQSRCGELRLVGLSPFGMRLFTAVRREGRIEVETLADQPLPFSPAHVLRDVERTFFRSGETPTGDTVRTIVRQSERVLETWRAGVLVSREITESDPRDSRDARTIVIRYRGVPGAAAIPPRIDLTNPHFGYVLEIQNFEAEELTCPQPNGP
jgi:hypothetical protein